MTLKKTDSLKIYKQVLKTKIDKGGPNCIRVLGI